MNSSKQEVVFQSVECYFTNIVIASKRITDGITSAKPILNI